MESELPFHRTWDPETNPEPVTVSVNAGPPASAEPGLNALITGGVEIVNVTLFDTTVPGFIMPIAAAPALAIYDPGTVALS